MIFFTGFITEKTSISGDLNFKVTPSMGLFEVAKLDLARKRYGCDVTNEGWILM